MSDVIVRIIGDSDSLRAALKQLNADLGQTSQAAQSAGEGVGGFSSSMDRLGTAASVALGSLAAHVIEQFGGAIVGAIGSVIDFSSQLQQASVAFATMTGSAEVGQQTLAELQQFAKTTPFDFPDALEGAKRLLAMGTSARDLVPTMGVLGDIAAGVGREKLPQLILAFGQVQSAGHLTGMELRQFSEAGVPLLATLAQSAGVSMAEISKRISDGAVSFVDVRNALSSLTSEGGRFFNLMENQSHTFEGAMSNIRDSLRFATEQGFKPFFDRLSEGANKIADFLMTDQFQGFVNSVAGFMGDAADAIGTVVTVGANLARMLAENQPLLEGIAAVIGGLLAPALFTAAAGFIATVAPIAVMGLGLAALAAAVAVVIDHFSLFQQAGDILGTALGRLANWIGEKVTAAFQFLGNVVGQVVGWIRDRVAEVADIIGPVAQQIGLDLSGVAKTASITGFNVAGAWQRIGDFASTAGQVVGVASQAVGGAFQQGVSNARVGLDALGGIMQNFLGQLTQPIQFASGEVQKSRRNFQDGYNAIGNAAKDAGGKAKDGAAELAKAAREAAKAAKEAHDAFVKGIGDMAAGVAASVGAIAAQYTLLSGTAETSTSRAADAFGKGVDALKGLAAAGLDTSSVFATMQDSLDALRTGFAQATPEQQALASATINALDGFLSQADALQGDTEALDKLLSGMSPVIAQARELAKTLEQDTGKAVEGLSKTIEDALGSGTGATIDVINRSLADFAKAQWIQDLKKQVDVYSGQIYQALKAGLDPADIIASAQPTFDAYKAALTNTAEEVKRQTGVIADALKQSLGTGSSGSALDLVRSGLADFAKAEWIRSLESAIATTAGEIQAALKAGLDPSDIVAKAQPLFEAYKAAMANTAEEVKRQTGAIADTLKQVLGSGAGGSTLDIVRKGLDDFARAEWIKRLEAAITETSKKIQAALAAGLDPSDIIAKAQPLFEAYRGAIDSLHNNAAKAVSNLSGALITSTDQLVNEAKAMNDADNAAQALNRTVSEQAKYWAEVSAEIGQTVTSMEQVQGALQGIQAQIDTGLRDMQARTDAMKRSAAEVAGIQDYGGAITKVQQELERRKFRGESTGIEDALQLLAQNSEFNPALVQLAEQGKNQSLNPEDTARFSAILSSLPNVLADLGKAVGSTWEDVTSAWNALMAQVRDQFSNVAGHASGGSFRVAGAGGVDTNLVSMRLSAGELVNITPVGGSAGGTIEVNAPITNYGVLGVQDFQRLVLEAVQTAQRRGVR